MKTRININPITNNFLDRSFQNLLFPMRCLQHMLFLSSFSIEYNCIRPHRASYYIVSFIGTLGFIIFHMQNLLTHEYDGLINPFLIVFIKLNVTMLVVPYASFFILNIIRREDHVFIMLKIQKAYRVINFKQYKKSIINCWSGIFRHCLGFIVSVSWTRSVKIAIYFYTLMYFDTNLTYGVFIITLLRDGIDSWIPEVEYYSKLNLELGEDEYNDELKKLFQAYIDLMDAFDIFKKIFKITTLYQALDTFFHSLLYFQTIIEITITGETVGATDTETFKRVTLLWLVKNVTFVGLFSLCCERFYLSVSEADAACCRLLECLQSTVEAKRLCKNVRRLNRAAFHKMTACGMFTIDGRLPHVFNSLVVEYTVVIIQFAILSWRKAQNMSTPMTLE